VIYVTQNGAGAKDGSSWDHAYGEAEFCQHLNNSPVGTEFWVAAGKYRPSTTGDKTWYFVLDPGVSLYGGFAGTETSRNQRNWRTNVTVLTGDLNFNDTVDARGVTRKASDINTAGSGNSIRVLYAYGQGGVLDGFTVTAGYALNDEGGGMMDVQSSVTIRNCTFAGNFSSQTGGGLYSRNSFSTLENCVFSGNESQWGGGMYTDDSASVMDGCTFTENEAAYGGGMATVNSHVPEVKNCTFSKNTASDRGGGMYTSNSANVSSSTFTENSASDGGGMFCIGYAPKVTNCTFSGNTASSQGGGINNYWLASTTIMNCTFSGNGANQGGNMANLDSSPAVTNSIFWNSAAGGEIFNDATSIPVLSHCVVQGGYPGGTEIITGDPKLGPLADNGGLTRTRTLLTGSSAIDAGKAAGAPSEDQRGISRPQGSGYDIGAFEVEVGGGGGSGGGCSAGGGSLFALLLMLAPLALLRRRG
jgi:predicted outer membrane repeat protein